MAARTFAVITCLVLVCSLSVANGAVCTTRNKPVPHVVDYIVMGGGTAGSVVASRLSASILNTVLVIDVGTDDSDNSFTQDPTNWATVAGSPLDWDDIVGLGEPVVFQDLQKRHITSGRTLGGSSAINSAMWIRSDRSNYDNWNVLNPGWGYDDLLPFFKGVETSDRYATDPYYHGNNGPHRVTGTGDNWYPAITDAAIAAGLSFVSDWNGAHQITNVNGSIGYQERSEVNGIRQNAFKSFIKPNLCRPNLFVQDHSIALKVNFDALKRARSVTWVDNETGKSYTTKALKEVVMSLGTVRSSQILRLSGVGNATELAALGVPVIKNLPGVGQNLQDHPITKINLVSPTSTCGGDRLKEGHLFIRSQLQDSSDPRPDIQALGITTCPSVFSLVYVITPHSRGWVELYSNDPTQRAGVRMNFFKDPHDLQTLIAGVRKVYEIYHNSPLNSTCPTFKNIYDDTEVGNFIIGTQYVRSDTNSGMHLVGTCKMGPASDPMAVVDNRLRVYGVSRLRIADASIMPEITSGNTQCPTFTIGAKAAAMILEDNSF